MVIRIGSRKRGDSGIYIGRPSRFGNPYRVGKDGTHEEVVKKYRSWFSREAQTPRLAKALEKLYATLQRRGEITLVCWCPPELPCHGEVIAEWLVNRAAKDGLKVEVRR